MTITFQDLYKIVGGKLYALPKDREVTHLLIDSRKLIVHPGAVFFAINGVHHDGHQFVEAAFNKGIRQFVVSDVTALSKEVVAQSNVLLVDDAVSALQSLCGHHRSHFNVPVLAITGSNGKTMVKEWLSQLISPNKRVVKSPKSYNSQVGVPLSIWEINKEHEVGIFEAGISTTGEMERLENVIKPTIGIFTGIGTAHDEGFESSEEKLREKLKLFRQSEKLIYCEDQEEVVRAISKFNKDYPQVDCISWSTTNPESNHFVVNNDEVIQCDGIEYVAGENDWIARQNLATCIVSALEVGLSSAEIQVNIKQLEPISMRLELKRGTNGCFLIDDSYNNDLAGLQIALDFMSRHQGDRLCTVILSDIPQSGMLHEHLYREVNQLLINRKVSHLIGVGYDIKSARNQFTITAEFFDKTDELIRHLSDLQLTNETILIKGARSFHFEQVVNLLQERIHGTRLEVDLNAITDNLNYYRRSIPSEVKLMVMVKALAYGGGSYEIASLLEYHRIDYLGVAYVDEAVELRKKGITLPIMVMNVSPESFGHLGAYNLEPEIYSINQLKLFLQYFDLENIPLIHLKIDTGMHRLGFVMDEIEDMMDLLRSNPSVRIGSVFTHLATADDNSQKQFSVEQLETFNTAYDKLCIGLGIRPPRHALNSAGISNFPEYQFEMVRLGIGLYGIEPAAGNHLSTVSNLKTSVSQVKNLKAGDTVGYGRKFKAEREMKIATVAIGYADGYDRRFGNGIGRMMINGRVVKVVGNVCMDMTMVDIEDVEVEEGDDVLVFGDEPSVAELANAIGTIPYEILTGIGSRVKRVFLSD